MPLSRLRRESFPPVHHECTESIVYTSTNPFNQGVPEMKEGLDVAADGVSIPTRMSVEVMLGGAERQYLLDVSQRLGVTEAEALLVLVQTALRLRAIFAFDVGRPTTVDNSGGSTVSRSTDASGWVAPNWRLLLLAGAFVAGIILAVLYILRHGA